MPAHAPTRAIVLLSGGLDSVTCLALAKAAGHELYALSFRYGQRHAIELRCAERQAARAGVRAHEIVDLGHLGRLVAGATALVEGSTLGVPKDREPEANAGIPSTYVPARNTLFLSYALAWAEVVEARSIYIGVNALDYSGYPDCRPAFIEAFETTANLGTKAADDPSARFTIEAPLQHLHKHEIIELGVRHGVDYADTVSCYDPNTSDDDRPAACGRCDSCQLRRRGFERARLTDPTRYA